MPNDKEAENGLNIDEQNSDTRPDHGKEFEDGFSLNAEGDEEKGKEEGKKKTSDGKDSTGKDAAPDEKKEDTKGDSDKPDKAADKDKEDGKDADKGEKSAQDKLKERSETDKTEEVDNDFWDSVKASFPDAEKIVNSDEFSEWIEAQPAGIKKMSNSPKAADAITILKMFEKDNKASDQADKKEDKGKDRDKKEASADAEVPDILKDVTFKIGGKRRSAEWVLEEYGEMGETMLAMAKVIAEKAQPKVSGEDKKMRETVKEMAQELGKMKFWSVVQEDHPDARKVAASKEFAEWKSKQSKAIQRLCNSADSDDAIHVLSAYKEFMSQEERKQKDAGKREVKDRVDGLHGQSLRSKITENKRDGARDADEFIAGFNS